MLYVHSLMGDARPGEVDPEAIGPRSPRSSGRSPPTPARFHGPYRVEGSFARSAQGRREPATATIRVLSAAGAPIPA